MNENRNDTSVEKAQRRGGLSGLKGRVIIIVSVCIAVCVALIGIAAIEGKMSVAIGVWEFISRQILGMKWLDDLIGLLLEGIGGIGFASAWYGAAIRFFIFDTVKIIVLLCLLIFLISYIQSYFPPERTKKILSKFGGLKGNILGALLGTVTPFCSCSSIPLFIGFTKAGVRSGVTFSFLISSPLVDLGALIHNVIPAEWVSGVLGRDKPYSVLVAGVVGVPMYADIFGTIPIAEALWSKGVGVGTILTFMMSVTALSLPSMIMLSKVVKPKLLAAFIGIVVLGIIIIGYVFNALNFLFV